MTPLLGWLDSNWFNLIQTGSLVIGLIFAGLSFRRETRSRQVTNLLALKQEHRELWSTVHSRPELARILQADVDLLAAPVTTAEEIFLRELIVHVATAWELIRDGIPLNLEALRSDVGACFSLPIPRWAWERARHAQTRDFTKFFDSALKEHSRNSRRSVVKSP